MSQNQITEKDFYARDVFPQWKKLIKKAKTSVFIYSPYLNGILNELIKSVNSGVKIKIYTRLDEDTLCGNIKTLLKAYEQGASIFHLSELHAKVLLVDNEFVSIGSQNFTYGGTKNKEASFISRFSFVNSEFLTELKKWNTCADKISRSHLKELDENIVEDCRRFQNEKSKLKKKIEDISKKHEKRSRELITEGTANLTRYGTNKYLICRRSQNLLNWKKKKKKTSTALNKGEFYPIINSDTKQMIFARVNKTRISFVDNRKKCRDVVIGNEPFQIFIVLPKKDYDDENIRITLKGDSGEKIKLKYFFDGKYFLLKEDENMDQPLKQDIISELNSKRDILYSLFEPFKPDVIVGKEHIADKFATGDKYETKINVRKGIGFFILKTD